MKTLTVAVLLCAIMALTTAAVVRPWVERLGPCPQPWSRIGSRCFRFFQTPTTWAKAERNCLSLGGHLASVHSGQEYLNIQKFIHRSSFSQPPTWIGGSDAQEDSIWFWSDGTRFDHTMWNPGEPNNYGGQPQQCIQMNWGGRKGWDDVECSTQLPFVCSK